MILGIVGSYRKGGIIDQAVSSALDAAQAAGAETQKIYLLDQHIEFCINCRRCALEPGPIPGQCFHQDEVPKIIEQIEAAEGYVLGAPVNFGNVNALTQRFFERLVCYSYWPWGQPAPKMRKADIPRKKAVLLTSSAMPALMGRLMTGAMRGLKLAAKAIGARPIAKIHIGLSAREENQELSERLCRRAQQAGRNLVAGG